MRRCVSWLCGLLGLGLLVAGGSILALNAYLGHTYHHVGYRHVVVDVLRADDMVRVDVDCRRVKTVEADQSPLTVDLGWLPDAERISVSVSNDRGDAAWRYRIVSDGEVIGGKSSGRGGSPDHTAMEFKIDTVETVAADGTEWGAVGCAQRVLVSAEVSDYRQLPISDFEPRPPAVAGPRPVGIVHFDLIEALATCVLPVLAGVGLVAGFATGEIRRHLFDHWRLSAGLAAIVVFDLLHEFVTLVSDKGVLGALHYGELIGVVLLFASAIVLISPHTGSQCPASSSTPSPNQT